MAALATACRASARLARSRPIARHFTSSAPRLAASNFIMPALSPTMTEGTIAGWKVKEGESFAAGDVLLEIETDKATMDVEAQEDGQVMRITAPAGSKAVQVGARIAVLAEPGDDLATLEMPPDEQPEQQAAADGGKADDAQAAARPVVEKGGQVAASEGLHPQKYPLMPAVEHLIKQNGLSSDDVCRIPPTGPNGRLLKGDVLAHLGTISRTLPAALSSRFEKMSHLDLSNIKAAAPKPSAPLPAAEPAAPPPLRQVQLPVSLAKVVEVQKKMQDALGVSLPLSTFVARATDFANDDLPGPPRAPTPDELFHEILGVRSAAAQPVSRGTYLPHIAAVHTPIPPPAPQRARRRDVFEKLLQPRRKAAQTWQRVGAVAGLSTGANVFSLAVPAAEERRAKIFLERCKLILEKEPGRLVL